MQIAQRLFQGVETGNGDIGRADHLSPHRFDDAVGQGAAGIGARDSRDVRRRVLRQRRGATRREVKNAQEAHEAIRPTDFRLRAAASSKNSRQRRAEDLRVDLEAHDGVADGRRARAAHDGRDFREGRRTANGRAHGERQGDRVCRLPPRLRRRQRRSGGGARRAGNDPAAVHGRRSDRRRTGDVGDAIALLDIEPKRHETSPPARFTEASLIKELEAARHRPAVDIRADDCDDRPPRLRVPPGQGAGAQLHGVRGDEAAARSLRRFRRDPISPPRWKKTSTRSRAASASRLEFLREFYFGDEEASRPAGGRRRQGAENADYPVLDLGVDPESGEPVRVRIGRFGPFVQVGEGGPGRTASLPDDIAPADLTRREGAGAGACEGGRAAHARRRSGDGQNVYVMNGRYGAYVQLGETPEGQEGRREAEARVAAAAA